MPTYQYSCTDCGHFFEAVQSFSDDSLTVCPECDGKLRKVFNAVGVVFKGSGFYRNDSRGSTSSTSPAAPAASSSSSESSSSSSSSDSGTSTSSSNTTASA
ncbi:MAG: FmdB family transcriptional regulator [Microbacterium sp.]|nr:MAG: FmdB family transcriptional regulator [Microbacterium sp.]